MRVFVLMGNDFPEQVFANEIEANEVCAKRSAADNVPGRKIYWRIYPFEMETHELHLEE